MGIQGLDGISWCDYTLNLWWGCTRVEGSPACGPAEGEPGAVCYAETWAERCGYNNKPTSSKFPIWGAHAERRWFGSRPLESLRQFERSWREEGMPERQARAFVMSMGDWAEGRPDQRDPLNEFWKEAMRTKLIDYLMLTKRPQLIEKLCGIDDARFWQGTTAENQRWLDIRWPHLRDTSGAIKWFSLEPMVGPIDLPQDFLGLGPCGWVVAGGQSGPGAITFDPAWARRLRDQCHEAGLPFHIKQMSGNTKAALQAIPVDLQIREWPTKESE